MDVLRLPSLRLRRREADGVRACRARLGPERGPMRRGSVVLTAEQAAWRAAEFRERVDLEELTLLSVDARPMLRQAAPDDVLLRLAYPGGTRLRLLIGAGDVDAVVERFARP